MKHAIEILEYGISSSQAQIERYEEDLARQEQTIQFAVDQIQKILRLIEDLKETVSQCDTAIQILQDRES